MPVVDLDSLKATLAQRIDRVDQAVAIAEAIDFATMRLSRDMRTFDQERRVELTGVTTEYTTLPTDFGGARMVKVDGERIDYYTAEGFQNYAENKLHPGKPIYTIVDNQIRVHPVPGGETIEILYMQRIAELVGGTDSNWVLDNHPDLYIAAAMAPLQLHMKDYAASDMWEARTIAMIREAIVYSRRRRYTNGQLVIRQG
jgi:hypothetical protein